MDSVGESGRKGCGAARGRVTAEQVAQQMTARRREAWALRHVRMQSVGSGALRTGAGNVMAGLEATWWEVKSQRSELLRWLTPPRVPIFFH